MIKIPTSDPSALLIALRARIKVGKINAWVSDDDGDLTLSSESWSQMAWFRPVKKEGSLNFYMVPPQARSISTSVYAVYHSRMIETLLRVFDDRIQGCLQASAMPEDQDDVG